MANAIFYSNASVLYPLSDALEVIYQTEKYASEAANGSRSAISSLSAQIANGTGQIGNFISFLPGETSARLQAKMDRYQVAARDLYNELRNSGPGVAERYFRFGRESQELYTMLFDLNKKLRIEGLATYNRGRKIYDSVVGLQTWVSIIGLALAVLIGMLVAISIIRPLQRLRQSTERLARGDLGAQVTITSRDEVGAVGEAFNQAVAELRTMVNDAAAHARQINTATSSLFAATEATGRSLGELNQLVEHLAHGATIQTDTVDSAIQTVQKATRGTDAVLEATFAIHNSCREASAAGQRGESATEEMRATIDHLVDTVTEIDRMVRALAGDSRQIRELADVINEIAEKTTLLSLNASIEAARAGEHGRGFAIVAANIRQLADQARQSVQYIHQVIDNTLAQTDQAVTRVAEGTRAVDRGRDQLLETVGLFKELAGRVGQITAKVEQITRIANQVGADNAAAIAEMTAVSRISQDNLAAVEEVAATFEGQSASANVVTDAARNLQRMAEELAAAADRFQR
ncbi:methyl-accepting chemotaxis protein [Hydrogenispora ethanolica]|uniref:Methyl-accepting chemotaxis protein n=1 Tax=Hydrogenispora ethanolica TaxID=1082276 RepID=A0A4R1SCG8_HYDET|nr:methyl-accepting chemotaxis protein [Hydrogenispora ethanolica]TCL76292.1 methyl-accepting chemotaxis protein [Hydrogenispora ethanolica]